MLTELFVNDILLVQINDCVLLLLSLPLSRPLLRIPLFLFLLFIPSLFPL
jgi:hypothetical protein